jgi:hypothetical protein
MMTAEKLTEAGLILEGQMELFPSVTESDVEQTLNLLKVYRKVKIHVTDYEQETANLELTTIETAPGRLNDDELYSDKTANAMILLQQQRKIYQKELLFTGYIEAAHRIIIDEDARKAIHYRYLQGYSHKETLLFFSRGTRNRTIERRLNLGILSIAETLKMRGVLLIEWRY